MLTYDIIKKKRDKGQLSKQEIDFIISGYTKGEIPDYQVAALLMAIFLHSFNQQELQYWTQAMLNSGQVIDLNYMVGAKIDKHSTGGIGDKISLILAPLVACLGVKVPMISGRGLGHTGGTLDKLESIPGFRVDLDEKKYAQLVEDIGLCLIGQTANIVPADKKLYALRDVIATVDSIPLISSSIMSKKLAEGIDGLVLDVKVGSGAFMKDMATARELAHTMVGIGQRMGKKVSALLTDMNQPLGRMVGNALEVIESIEVLTGSGPADTLELTLQLGSLMLSMAEIESDQEKSREIMLEAIKDGRAIDKFKQMVEAQGGDKGVVDNYDLLPKFNRKVAIKSRNPGFVEAIDTEKMGMAAILLGAGRQKVEDQVDPSVGFEVLAKIGNRVEKEEPLLIAYVNDENRLQEVEEMIIDAYQITSQPVQPPKLIKEVIHC